MLSLTCLIGLRGVHTTMAKSRTDRRSKAWRNTRPCPFCSTGTNPDWKDAAFLRTFLRPDGSLNSWKKTKCCDRHQRKLAKAIANTREMALLPTWMPKYRK